MTKRCKLHPSLHDLCADAKLRPLPALPGFPALTLTLTPTLRSALLPTLTSTLILMLIMVLALPLPLQARETGPLASTTPDVHQPGPAQLQPTQPQPTQPQPAQSQSVAQPRPPQARTVEYRTSKHGISFPDPYQWLKERDNAEVLDYLRAENAYAKAVMQPTDKGRETLFQEILARIKETDLSVPERIGSYTYYSRTEQGLQYSIHCRKPVPQGTAATVTTTVTTTEAETEEEIILDENALASGCAFFALGVLEVSPDHRLLAYGTDISGNEKITVFVKNLADGQLLPDQLTDTAYSCEWGNDNKTLFYTRRDAANRPYQVYRHLLGTPCDKDELLFQEDDERFYVALGKTRSRSWVIISSNSNTTTEVHLLSADSPQDAPKLFRARIPGVEYDVDHHGEQFFITTNEDGATNFKIMQTSVSNWEPDAWSEFLPHRPAVKIDGCDIFRNFMVIHERENGIQTMRLVDFQNGEFRAVEFPEPVYSYHGGGNSEYDKDEYRFTYNSLTTPRSVYDLDLRNNTWMLQKRFEVLGTFNSTNYQSERIFATSHDGVKVPVSLVYRRGLERNGQAPMYLTGYGAYGSSFDPYFSSIRLSLLDRGFVYAIAHVRGGEELGRPWYDAGKLMKKKNSFLDFIACAEHLIREKYTSTARLAINGGSAGGLLVGAAVTMRPDLFGCVVADVPFVDVMNTMLDSSLPLTAGEYEEWGDPGDPEAFAYMLSYSPYDNTRPGAYPPMLVTAGLNDPRVQYWEPAKWVARLRAVKTDSQPLLLKTDMDSGHAGVSGRYDYIKEIVFEYAFILKTFGVSFDQALEEKADSSNTPDIH